MRALTPLLCLLAVTAAFAQGTKADFERARSLDRRTTGKDFRDRVAPRWLPGGDALWYRVETGPGRSEHVLVDAIAGTRTGGLDAKGLAELLSKRLGQPVDPARLPGEPGNDAPRPTEDRETEITFINEA